MKLYIGETLESTARIIPRRWAQRFFWMLRTFLLLVSLDYGLIAVSVVTTTKAIGAESTPPPAALISIGDNWTYIKGTSLPSADWNDVSFDDSAWLVGPTGIGYSTDIAYPTDLPDMYGGYASFYMRKTFMVHADWNISSLTLDASYDDGFIVYINGVEVGRSASMAGQTGVTNSTTSDGQHDEEAKIDSFDLTAAIGSLVPGMNVLAIEVHNIGLTSSDAGMVPELKQVAFVGPDIWPPSNITSPIAVGFDTGIQLLWTNPVDPDFSGVVVLESTTNVAPVLVDGSSYSPGTIVGPAQVVYSDNGEMHTSSSLANGITYYYFLFAYDLSLNYSSGVSLDVVPNISIPGQMYVDNLLQGSCADYEPATRRCGAGSEQAYNTFVLATANASAGDTVYVRGGIYFEVLHVVNSGLPGNPITYKNYSNEVVTIDGVDSIDNGEDYGPIWLDEVNYIVVDGIDVTNSVGFGRAVNSHFNVIQNCDFSDSSLGINSESARGAFYFGFSHYNKILNNAFSIGTDSLALVASDYNVVQGNDFNGAGHTTAVIKCGNYNIFRDNTFSNFHQKTMEVYDCDTRVANYHALGDFAQPNSPMLDDTKHNLIENNRFILTGTNEGGPQSTSDSNGIQYAGQEGIIRYNVFYNNVGPALGMQVYSEEGQFNTNNRVYNNTVTNSECGGMAARSGVVGNIYKNNILAGNTSCAGNPDSSVNAQVTYRGSFPDGHSFINNNIFGTAPGQAVFDYDFSANDSTLAAFTSRFPASFVENIEVAPLFTDPSAENYTLQETSPMVDAGAFLTSVVGTGIGQTLVVGDARYFFDGFGIAGESGDLVQLAGDTLVSRIVAVDYPTNTITLESSVSFSDGQGISLAYVGSKPDIGAFEYQMTIIDTDSDGIPDDFEDLYVFLNPLDGSDAALDQDSDHFTNLEEFAQGSAPDDPFSNPGVLGFDINAISVDESAGVVSIPITRSGGSINDASVLCFTIDSTALAGSDYTDPNTWYTWADGEMGTQYCDIPILDDNIGEGLETFNAELNGVANAHLGEINSAVVTITEAGAATTEHDFNGDGNADVLIRHSVTGEWYLYPLNGAQKLPGNDYLTLTKDLAWEIVGTNDFDGDGNADVLIRHSVTGLWYFYPLNGAQKLPGNGDLTLTKDLAWEVAGTNDFDGDGNADVLIRHNVTGRWYFNALNGAQKLPGSGVLSLTKNLAWEVVGTNDFDGDGNADVLVRHSISGQWYFYPLNGTKKLPGSGYLTLTENLAWEVVGTNDFDGDGNADVLIRHNVTGRWYFYRLNGAQKLPGSGFSSLTKNLDWVPMMK